MSIKIFNIKEGGNHFQWKTSKEAFQQMRGALMRMHDTSEKPFTYLFVNELDKLQSMKVGETLFFDTYPFGAFSARTLEEFNRTSKGLQEFAEGDGGKNLCPSLCNAFCIRRTESRYIYRKLDYEYED